MNDEFEINGIKLSGTGLGAIINALTIPDPRKWYRFRRVDDQILVTVEILERDVEHIQEKDGPEASVKRTNP